MNTLLIQRIEKRLKELGITAARASVMAGFGSGYIRDIKRFGTMPNVENLGKLASALRTSPSALLGTSEDLPIVGLYVEGTVEAGNFRDISLENQEEDLPVIRVAQDPRFPNARQYALLIHGDSMNQMFADGCYVTCVDFAESGLPIRPGLIVHVDRIKAGLHETTLKVVEQVDGGPYMLAPRSSNPRHKPIALDDDKESEIRIRGVVTGQWAPVSID